MSALPTIQELAAMSKQCADIAAFWPTAEVIRVIDDPAPELGPELESEPELDPVDDINRVDAVVTSVRDLPLHLSYFPVGKPKGPALGNPRDTTWGEFCDVLTQRRQGDKDGPNFIPARFTLEPDGKQVRRLKANVLARTAIAIDVETNAKTGEVPPSFDAAVEWVRDEGWAGVVYTSHNHTTEAPRYRIVLPLSGEIDPDLPAVEVVADELWLSSVMDWSKRGASSLFYMPSCDPGKLDGHRVEIIDGDPIDAGWIRTIAGEMLAEQQAERERTKAHAKAETQRKARIATGPNPDDSLIEKLRPHLDLQQMLLAHEYDQQGTKFRHSNSKSGSYGADVRSFGGVERVYSHNAGDPLHRDNLPEWCDGVTALDAFDVAAILDFGGDRKKAMAELAKRFGITRANERRAVARLIHRMRDAGACQEAIEAAAFVEGEHLGLSKEEVISVAKSVAAKIAGRAR
jgi:hypothetical protein